MNTNLPEFLSKSIIGSDIMQMKATRPEHHRGLDIQETPDSTALNFAELLNRSLQKVNDQQVEAEKLTQQMISDPGSVEMHTVTIAAEKARMAITFTKTIADMAIRTYRDLVNLR
jgi:flagellar hook-basal body complex protein FliE